MLIRSVPLIYSGSGSLQNGYSRVRLSLSPPLGYLERFGVATPFIVTTVKRVKLTHDRLINAIGSGERIALSRLAVTHLERTNRPIRIAVDISIWLFQAQAGRGGQNPELRTLFFRLIRLLALPIHPLFVYDGSQKPPFKRGKATSRSYGAAPIIRLSKTMIDIFKFPRHDAPGEAEAECARLQRAGVVDAVMSNDVDALMFGSRFTVMNFSRENSTGTTAATHVDCYRNIDHSGMVKNVKLSRAGMILFAMLSGGDYLPSGVAKCGSKLAAEIAKAGFGDELLDIIASGEDSKVIDSKLAEWRDRLQYELDENESGYFQHKHKAVKIPDGFPDRMILSFYAQPIVSDKLEIESLQSRLEDAWDHEIDIYKLRTFAGDTFDWKYRSGARSIVRKLAEPLLCRRLRLRQPVVAMEGYGSFVPNYSGPSAQKVYKSRKHYSTDGLSQLQLDMVPIDIVGLDLEAEEPNPPSQSALSQTGPSQAVDNEEDPEIDCEGEVDLPTPSISGKPRKWYNPYETEKIWVFESLAVIGILEVVEKWRREQELKTMPKKPATKRYLSKKKKVIDPGMKPGGILRYAITTKPGSELSKQKASQLVDAAKTPSSTRMSQQIYQNEFSFTPPESSFGHKSSSEFSNLQMNCHKNSIELADEVVGYPFLECSTSITENCSLYDISSEIDQFGDNRSSRHLVSPRSLIKKIDIHNSCTVSPPLLLEITGKQSTRPSLESTTITIQNQEKVNRLVSPGKTKPFQGTDLGTVFKPLSLKTPPRKPPVTRQCVSPSDATQSKWLREADSPRYSEVIILESSPDIPSTLPEAHFAESSPSSRKQIKQKDSKNGKRNHSKKATSTENDKKSLPDPA